MSFKATTHLPEVPKDSAGASRVLKEYMEQSRDDSDRRLVEEFSLTSLAWLVLPPTWSYTLAEACGFPTHEDRSLRDFVRRAIEGRVVQEESPVRGEARFTATDCGREQVLRILRRNHALSKAFFHCSEALEEVLPKFKGAPEVLYRWLKLARSLRESEGLDTDSPEIIELVQQAIDRDETGVALGWLRTGESLAAIAGPQFRSSVRLAGRRLELAHRRFEDRLHLADFMPREEQIEAFNRLLISEEQWALHYLGVGGVGKTMLLRYITSVLAQELGCSISRIDFDFISPDYPLRRPGQLLLELGDDLKLHSDTQRADAIYERFRDRLQGLHDILDAEPPPGDPLANIRRSEFEDALVAFADFVQYLPSPVVLVLDTCEELAKLHPDSGHQPGVEATFQIVERLKARVPRLRVVFSGRRPLARAGFDWKTVHGTYLTEAKAYLGLHQIRGFTETESYKFIRDYKKLPQLSKEMTGAILRRSRAYTKEERISMHSAAEMDARGDERFNPFDLDLYLEWIKEDSSLSAEQISTGKTDPFVEMRIVYRLNKHPDVRKVLPLVVLLRRFEENLFHQVAGLEERAEKEVFAELRQQEWIKPQRDQELNAEFLAIDHHLQPRLDEYFAAQITGIERQRVGHILATHVTEMPLRRVSLSYIDTALRLLPQSEAVDLWWQINDRVPKEADWAWADIVTKRLMREEDPTGADRREPAINAAIRATRVFALRHTDPNLNPAGLWLKVQATAEAYPQLPRFALLSTRAILGQIAAQGKYDAIISGSLIRPYVELVDSEMFRPDIEKVGLRDAADKGFHNQTVQFLGALASAAEGVVWALERKGGNDKAFARAEWLLNHAVSLFIELEPVLASVDGEIADADSPLRHWPILRTFIDTLRMRFYKLVPSGAQNAERDDWAAELTGRMLNGSDDQPPPQIWEDVTLPECFEGYALCLAFTTHGKLAWDRERLRDVLQRIGFPEIRYAISLHLRHRLIRAPLPTIEELNSIEKALSRANEADSSPTSDLPQRAPFYETMLPLWCSLAETYAALGHFTIATRLLFGQLDNQAGWDRTQADLRHALRVGLKIARTARSSDVLGQVRSRFGQTLDWIMPDLMRTTFLLDKQADSALEGDVDAANLHAHWQTMSALGRARAEFAEMWGHGGATRQIACSAAQQQALWLDKHEAVLILGEADILQWPTVSVSKVPVTTRYTVSYVEQLEAERDLMERNRIRERFLGSMGNETNVETDLRNEGPSFSKLRQAELMLEEGELLIHRVPDIAATMLDDASNVFDEAGGSIGAFIAGLLEVLARIHAGDPEAARDALEGRLADRYRQLVKSSQNLGLPSWEQLERRPTSVSSGEQRSAYATAEVELDEWLDILAQVRGWLAVTPDKVAAQEAWLDQVRQGPHGHLPDLDFGHLMAKLVSPPNVTQVRDLGFGKVVSWLKNMEYKRFWLGLGGVFLGILFIGVYVGLWVGLYKGFWWIAELFVPPAAIPWTLWKKFPIFLLGFSLFFSPVLLFPTLRDSLYTRFGTQLRLAFRIEPAGTTKPQNASVTLGGRFDLLGLRSIVRLVTKLLFEKGERIGQDKRFDIDLPQQISDYYSAKEELLPKALADLIRTIHEFVPKPYRRAYRIIGSQFTQACVPVPIDYGTSLHTSRLPLEALLLAPVMMGDADVFRRTPLIFWRRFRKPTRNIRSRQTFRRFLDVVFSDSPTVDLRMHSDWGDQRVWEKAGWERVGDRAECLHLIGSPVRTRVGVRLNVRGPEGNHTGEYSTKETDKTLLSENLGPGDLPVKSVQLIVVQLEPGEIAPRGDSDFEELALLREFCDTLVQAGAAMVLLIPMMSPVQFREVLPKALSQIRISSSKRRLRTGLFRCVWQLRWGLLAESKNELEALRQAAADIALFISDD